MASIRFTTRQQDPSTDSAAPSSPFRLRVSDVMSTALVTAAPDEQIAVVRDRAEARRVHHVVVLHASGGLAGILCLCDMERAGPGASAREAMSICPLFTSSGDTLAVAAETLERYGIGALPVLDASGQPIGIVTRSDLRARGALPDERGVDRCASCGASHELCPKGANDTCFCRSCLNAARQSEEESTLGVGD